MRYCFFSNKLSGRMRPRLISLLHLQCRARGVLPFFRSYIRVGVSFFLHLPASGTHVYVCYPIEYAMRMCSEIPRFFFFFRHSFSSLSTRVSVSVHLLSLERFEPVDFPNKDVISVDYGVCIPT